MPQILDGKIVREEIFANLKPRLAAVQAKLGRPPGLAVVLVGEDPASKQYVQNKIKGCADLGICSRKVAPAATISTEQLLKELDKLNHDPAIDAILVQMPLPKQVDSRKVLEAVAPGKDADGFHPLNVGHLVAGRPAPRACTPAGIMEMLKYYRIAVDGRKAAVVGRSDIIGKPMALLLLQANATVTVCHSRTPNLAEECHRADIIVAAIGKPALITADFIRRGATVIDVGTSRITDRAEAERLGRANEFAQKGAAWVGDVNPVDVEKVAGAYSPVPGGVGPLTIAMLMSNTVQLAEQHG
ncbi:MAG: bifunctional methylenetetrahydrofolate dehydrogenase/methenyltetrahydrofolate cyclohydrolase FolD [Bryobacterales bacterium]|nr:bifunctional methylenetetrahydrofolate dehydrogenase/methenyltetrahydrofolate cyclohydrolase FolD [Bryobacterales bacterium]